MPEGEGHSGVEVAAGPETAELDISVETEGFEDATSVETETESVEDALIGDMMIRNVNGIWLDESDREFMSHDLALKAEILSLEVGQSRTNEALGQTLEGDDVIFENIYTMTNEGLQFSWAQREIGTNDQQPGQEQLAAIELSGAESSSPLEAMIAESNTRSFELPSPSGDGGEPAISKPAESTAPTESRSPRSFEIMPGSDPSSSTKIKSETTPKPKVEVKQSLWRQPQPETKTNIGPLSFLQEPTTTPDTKPAPKPESPQVEKPASPTEKPAVKAEQAHAEPEAQPEPEAPTDSPEPTGGQAAEQPRDQPVAVAQTTETPTETPSDTHTESTPPAVEAQASDAAEATMVPNTSPSEIVTTEPPAAEAIESAAIDEPAVITETTSIDADSTQERAEAFEPDSASLTEAPAPEVVVIAQEAPELVDTSRSAPDTRAEYIVEPVVIAPAAESKPEPATQAEFQEPAISQEPTVLEAVEAPTANLVIPVPTENFAQPIQMSESIVVQLRPEAGAHTAASKYLESTDLIADTVPTEESLAAPAYPTAPLISNTMTSPSPTAQTDTFIQASEDGLDIAMSMSDQAGTRVHRQTRTHPVHMTVNATPPVETAPPTDNFAPPVREIPSEPFATIDPVAPVEAASKLIGEPTPTIVDEPSPLAPPPVETAEPAFQSEPPRPAPLELQAWAKDFGIAVQSTAPSFPQSAEVNTPFDAREETLPLFFDNSAVAFSAPTGEDDDPALVISFDETERRHPARRAHSSRSTTA
ncbi:MAG TPA: hypothetical protein VGH44_03675 [Candidatus Saccharimonadia bacterium]